jgi:hypothetical protein
LLDILTCVEVPATVPEGSTAALLVTIESRFDSPVSQLVLGTISSDREPRN